MEIFDQSIDGILSIRLIKTQLQTYIRFILMIVYTFSLKPFNFNQFSRKPIFWLNFLSVLKIDDYLQLQINFISIDL